MPASLPADSDEEWFAYGVSRPIAQGLSLDLDIVTETSRRSALGSASDRSRDTFDYNPAPESIDPPGYTCMAAPLPVGSVVCRQISSGYVTGTSGPILARYAIFYSYDARGRVVRKYGPVDLDRPGANDVPPLEERTYWADGASPARQGRLHELKRYPSPTAAPLVTTYDYDMFGVAAITAPDGSRTMYIKDGRGRATFVVTADAGGVVQGRTETRYFDGNSPRLRILPSGAAERYSYDSKGRLMLIEHLSADPEASGANPVLGWSESHAYDQAGNRIHSERRDAQGLVTWRQDRAYDEQHRVVWESNPDVPSSARTWTYDATGGLASNVDEDGRRTEFTPDGLNRINKVTRRGRDALGNPVALDVATYQFPPGQSTLGAVTDGDGRSTTYVHDDFGRVEHVNAPSLSAGGPVWYRYDARGNVTARGDQHLTVTYTYDGLDRVITTTAQNTSDGSSLTFQNVYDERGFVGRLTSVLEPDRTVTYGYDARGQLASETWAESGVSTPLTTAYRYDADGLLYQTIYPSGLSVQFDRDLATRRVVAVRDLQSGTVYATNIGWQPGGPLAGLTFGNGRTLTQRSSLRYEPVEVRSGPVWLNYGLTPSGDIRVVQDQSEDVSGCSRSLARSITYDFLGRLTEWSDAAQSGTGICPPDSIGSAGAAFEYVTGTDRIARQRSPDQTGPPKYAFGYDDQGNISAIGQYDPLGSTITSAVCLRHDALGRLTLAGSTGSRWSPGGRACVTDADVTAPLFRFKYDARNRRVARQVGGQWIYVVVDGAGNPLSELALVGGAWTKVRDYLWLEGRLLAQVEYSASAVTTYFAHVDHLGTPRALTNASGQVVWSAYQRPYAELLEKMIPDPLTGSTVVTNLRLPGQYDERLFAAAGISGLQGPYYNWNRWYLPSVGRYLELDPIALEGDINGFASPDWYNYALANPLSNVDPQGKQAAEGAAGGAAICGPPCALAGFLAGVGAAALLGKIGSDVIDNCRSTPKNPRRGGYECTAKCQASSATIGAYYVTGTSDQNCGQATLNAKAQVPLGQYPRHCSCSDTDGFRGVGHQCEAHTR